MGVFELEIQNLTRRAGNFVSLVARILDVCVACECVSGANRQMIGDIAARKKRSRQLVAQSRFNAAVPRPRRVPVRGHCKGRAGKGLHIDVEDLVLELDIIRRDTPVESRTPAATAELVLPGALSLEGNVSRHRQAIELEQQRRLEAATGVAENLGCSGTRRENESELRTQGTVAPLVRLIPVGKEEILRLPRRLLGA